MNNHKIADVRFFLATATHPKDNTNAGLLGFYLWSGGRNIAAVSTLPLGRVWFEQSQHSERQDELVMGALGLWFYYNGFDSPVVNSD